MKVVKLNDKKYDIPTSWLDISYQKFLDLKELERHMPDMDELDYNLKTISVLTDISEDVLMNIEMELIESLLIDIYKFSKTDIVPMDDLVIEIKGKTYILDKDLSKLTFGFWIDLEGLVQGGDVWDNADKIAACFLRANKNSFRDNLKVKAKRALKKNVTALDFKIEKHSYDVMLKNAELFKKELSIPYIYSIMVFFLVSVNRLQGTMSGSFLKIKDQILNQEVIER